MLVMDAFAIFREDDEQGLSLEELSQAYAQLINKKQSG